MSVSSLILNNPKAAFWVISAFWVVASVLVWGPLFAYLGYKVRMSREGEEHKARKKEILDLRTKVMELDEEVCALRAKRKAAQMALA